MRRTRRVLVWVAAIAALCGVLLIILLASPITEKIAAAVLSRALSCDVRVADAAVDLHGRIRLRGVEINSRGHGLSSRVAYLPLMVIERDGLFSKRLQRIDIRHGELFVRARPQGGLDLPESGEPTAASWTPLPRVVLDDCRIELEGVGPLKRACRRLFDRSVAPALEHLRLQLQPAESGGWRITGAARAAPVGEMRVDGRLDPRERQTRIVVGIEGMDLEAMRDNPAVAAALREMLRERAVAGRASLELGIEASPEAGFHVQGTARLLEASVRLGAEGRPVERIEAALRLDGGDLAVRRLTAEWKAGRLESHGRINDLFGKADVALEGTVAELELGPDLRAILPASGRRTYDDFTPEGPIRATFRLAGSLAAGSLRPEIDVELRGVDASYVGHRNPATGHWSGFPFALYDLRGGLQIRPERIRIDGLEGRTEEGLEAGTVRITGAITEHGTVYDIGLECDGVRVGDKLRAAIRVAAGEKELRAFDAFRPEGPVDAAVKVQRRAGEPVPKVTIDATLRGVAAVYAAVPYPLEGMTGHLVIGPEGVSIDGIEGRHGEALVGVDGRIERGDGESGASDLRIHGSAIELDEDLYAALIHEVVPDLLEVTQPLGLAGRADFSMHLARAAGREGRFHLVGHLTEGRLRPTSFPLPVEDVTADFRVGDLLDGAFTIEVWRLEGRRAGGPVRATYLSEAGGPRHLEVTAQRQPLDAPFMTALEAAAPEEAARMRALEASGEIDVSYGRHHGDAGGDRTAIRARVRDGAFRLSGLPDRIEGVEGAATIQRGDGDEGHLFDVSDATARLGAGLIDVRHARIRTSPSRLTVDVDARATDLHVSPDLAGVLAEDVRGLFERLALDGEADVAPLRVHYDRDLAQDAPALVDYDGEVRLRDATVGGFLPAHDLSATVEVHGRRGGRRSRVATRAVISDLRAEVGGLRAEGVRARIQVTPRGVTLDEIEGVLAGGLLPVGGNALFVDLAAPYPFDATFTFAGCDLRRIVGDRVTTARNVNGALSGKLQASGELDHLARLSGSGRIEVRHGQLWELPVFADLFRKGLLRNLGVSGFPVFDRGHVAFRVKEGRILIDDMVLDSPAMTLTGRGAAGASGLNVDVVPSVAPSIPIIGLVVDPLFDLIKQGTLAFRVSGPFDSPEITWNPRLLNPLNLGSEPPDWPIMPTPRRLAWRERF